MKKEYPTIDCLYCSSSENMVAGARRHKKCRKKRKKSKSLNKFKKKSIKREAKKEAEKNEERKLSAFNTQVRSSRDRNIYKI